MLVLRRLIAFAGRGVAVLPQARRLRRRRSASRALAARAPAGATPVMDDIIWFHDFLLWIIAAITLFVLVLLLIVIVRFNARANPTPSRTTHNTCSKWPGRWCRW